MSRDWDLKKLLRHAPQYLAAELLGVTVQWLAKLPEAPRNPDKTYNLCALHAWRVSQKVSEAEARNVSDENPDDLRYKAARADKLELELAERRGELWPASEVKVEVAGAFETAKRTMLSFSGRLAPQLHGLPPEEIAQVLDGAVRDCLDELGEALKVVEPEQVKEAV